MSTVMQSARGASAYTQMNRSSFSPAAGAGLVTTTPNTNTQAWAEIIDQLLRIRNLQDDWDGEGSPAPPSELVDAAITWAKGFEEHQVPPPERVLATGNGTVSLEWHNLGGYRELEVTSPNNAELSYVPPGAKEAQMVQLSRR